jgi:hypothetical protein
MAASALINWSWPWLADLRPQWSGVAGTDDVVRELNRRGSPCATHGGHAIRFVPQDELPAGIAYEAFIHATGRVPTRNNLHDFYNGIMWFRYPRIKAALNARQAEQIRLSLGTAHRGPTRDAATLFDENALLLVTPDADLVAALRRHDWAHVFGVARATWNAQVSPRLFGHALIEKLMQPYDAITAHVWHVALPADASDEAVDLHVAGQLARCHLVPPCFSPMPVLGVPGWWPANEELRFYDNDSVFRPARAVVGALHACTCPR